MDVKTIEELKEKVQEVETELEASRVTVYMAKRELKRLHNKVKKNVEFEEFKLAGFYATMIEQTELTLHKELDEQRRLQSQLGFLQDLEKEFLS